MPIPGVQSGLAGQLAAANKRPMMGRPRPKMGLAPSAPTQGRLIKSEAPEGPSTQGYGKPAMAPASNMAKLEPTGGVQMGATTQVGADGSRNPRSGMMPGMVRSNFGDMGRPGMAFQPQTELEQTAPPPGFERPMSPRVGHWNRIAQNMAPVLQAYRNRGMGQGQDMSWMDQPGALALGPGPGMGMQQPPQIDQSFNAMANPDVMSRGPEINQAPQAGLSPSPQMDFNALAQRMGRMGMSRMRPGMNEM